MGKHIDGLSSSRDLQAMHEDELQMLAEELRETIIQTVSTNGGHLASNLGSVELTLAILKRFDAYTDRVIWDVGHQSYSWKLLTGRADVFHTLRKEGGLSGFPKREESLADAFNTGHSSTSISAAVGIARAKHLLSKPGKAIAVIGDGALTGGQAYEALNNIKADDNILVIINDNQMSIDNNVGSLARHLGSIRVNKRYLKAKSRIERLLEHIPFIGQASIRFIRYIKTLLRRAAVVEQSFFETLGLKYYGPIDGHNLDELDQYLEVIKDKKEAVILHVLTQKGRGYRPAEHKPSLYHGVAPFEVEVGVSKKVLPIQDNLSLYNCTSYTQAFSQSLMEIAHEDPNIVAITAAMAQGTGLDAFSKAYPERFFDVGIAEQHAVTMAAGLAVGGMKPVVAIYSSFLQRALDQVLHDVVLQRLHVVFCVDRAGIVGDDGETHQGLYDLAFLSGLPGLTVLCPSDYNSLYEMLTFALYQCNGPVVIRYPRGGERYNKAISRPNLRPALPGAEPLRKGRDLVIAGVGNMTSIALEAADQLQLEGIDVAVIDVRSVKPLDDKMILDQAMQSGQLLVIEETVQAGAVAQQLALKIASGGLQIKLKSLAIGDKMVLQASQARALEEEGLSVNAILQAAKQMIRSRDEAIR